MLQRQRYKLHDINRISPHVAQILKTNRLFRAMELVDDEPPLPEFNPEDYMVSKKSEDITLDDAADIAELVTKIDTDLNMGVEALFVILQSIQAGASGSEALLDCKTVFKTHYKAKKPKK